MSTGLWTALLCSICFGICIFVIWYSNRRIRRILIAVQQKLDNAIAGNLQTEIYDESLDGAILERLNQLVTMAEAQRNRAFKERNDIMALISNIAHQVRTPLASVILYGEMLRERQMGSSSEKLVGKILRQSGKIEFFMKELVRTAYTEQEMIRMQPEKISVEELIAAACQNAELSSMKKGIVIHRTSSDEPDNGQEERMAETNNLYCMADRKWTVEALDNLLDNGIKYAPEGSQITVSAISYESFVCIEVKDEGPGIAEEEQGKIFERFYRSPSSLQIQGFGIGLYLVREIASRQGGYVRLRSSPGQGATFCLYLPKNLSNPSLFKKI